jgi:hypothetical protein
MGIQRGQPPSADGNYGAPWQETESTRLRSSPRNQRPNPLVRGSEHEVADESTSGGVQIASPRREGRALRRGTRALNAIDGAYAGPSGRTGLRSTEMDEEIHREGPLPFRQKWRAAETYV